jgi:type IV pilus assembly protein PilB
MSPLLPVDTNASISTDVASRSIPRNANPRGVLQPIRMQGNLAGRSIKLGESLVGAGIISGDDLDTALRLHAKNQNQLGETLLEMGIVEEDSLLLFLGEQIGIPAVRLRNGLVDPIAVKLIPRSKAESLCALGLFRIRDTLTVAMREPKNLRHIDELSRITGLNIRPVLAMRGSIERMLKNCYEENFAVDEVTADLDEDSVSIDTEAIDVSLADVVSLTDGSPVINLVNYIIVQAIRQKASDIHFEPSQNASVVRYRVDGSLREILHPKREFHAAMVSRMKVLAKLDISERRMPQDGRIHLRVDGREIDLRISTLPTILGEKVVMRVLDKKNVTFYLDKLGMREEVLTTIKELLRRPYGLLLTTGPTGSGKTTTLYSAVELIKSVHRNIVTVEDPVEYQLDMINQVQVSNAKSMQFNDALRSILRQDPDVIMVGEIRDSETASIAIQAALTGHLVLSTLHTNDSFGAVTRLRDMGIEPFKIAASVLGVIAQRLVRTICPACDISYYPETEQLDAIRYRGDRRKQFHRGQGCRECFDTGYRGRTGIYEIFSLDRTTREMITRNCTSDELRAYHRKLGRSLLLDEGVHLAESGRTTIDEVLEVAFCEE